MKIPETMNVWEGWNRWTTTPAMYEALAEECVELAQAALKMARALRAENPTPLSTQEAFEMVREEYTDVISCAIGLGLNVDAEQSVRKFRRMQERSKQHER